MHEDVADPPVAWDRSVCWFGQQACVPARAPPLFLPFRNGSLSALPTHVALWQGGVAAAGSGCGGGRTEVQPPLI